MDTLAKSRLSRRSVVSGGSLAALALHNSLATSSASGAHAEGRERLFQSGNLPTPRENTVVIEVPPVNVWDSFNPFIPNGEAYQYGVAIICRECLFYVNFLTGESTPWLGQEYSYNSDHTECTLTLNPQATWSDGEPFTAHDVVFTQEMLIKNPQLNGAAGLEQQIKKVSATDDHTVVWQLNAPDTRFHYRFLAGIVSDGMKVVPKHIWEKQDPGTFKNNPPIQTGPYVLKESSASKLYYLWEKNPDYWNKAELDPAPQYVLYRQWAEIDAAVQDFLAGNVDDPHRLVLDYLNQETVAAQTDQVSRYNFNDPCPSGFYFNVDSPSGLFKKPEGRWAMSHLIDRELMGNTIWLPPTKAATYPWADYESWHEWAPDSVMDQYDLTYGVDKANEILDSMGATERDGDGIRILNGKPLKLTMITPAETTGPEFQMGMVVVSSAKEAGIEIELKSMPGSAHWDAFDAGDYDISSHWICGMGFDPLQFYLWYHSDNYQPVGKRSTSGDNVRLKSKELDKHVDKLATLDPNDEANKKAFDDTLKVFMDELPSAASIQKIFATFFNTKVWQGWPTEDNPYTVPLFWWSHYLFVIGSLKKAS